MIILVIRQKFFLELMITEINNIIVYCENSYIDYNSYNTLKERKNKILIYLAIYYI